MPGFSVRGTRTIGGEAGDGPAAVATKEFLYNLLIYTKDMTTPTFSVGIENNQGASLEYKFAKNVTWDDIKITFYDTVGLIALLKRWRERVWTQEDGLMQANDYKRISELASYAPTWDAATAENWVLTGSWPSTIRHGDLTYTGSDVKIVEVTVTYDFADQRSPNSQ